MNITQYSYSISDKQHIEDMKLLGIWNALRCIQKYRVGLEPDWGWDNHIFADVRKGVYGEDEADVAFKFLDSEGPTVGFMGAYLNIPTLTYFTGDTKNDCGFMWHSLGDSLKGLGISTDVDEIARVIEGYKTGEIDLYCIASELAKIPVEVGVVDNSLSLIGQIMTKVNNSNSTAGKISSKTKGSRAYEYFTEKQGIEFVVGLTEVFTRLRSAEFDMFFDDLESDRSTIKYEGTSPTVMLNSFHGIDKHGDYFTSLERINKAYPRLYEFCKSLFPSYQRAFALEKLQNEINDAREIFTRYQNAGRDIETYDGRELSEIKSAVLMNTSMMLMRFPISKIGGWSSQSQAGVKDIKEVILRNPFTKDMAILANIYDMAEEYGDSSAVADVINNPTSEQFQEMVSKMGLEEVIKKNVIKTIETSVKKFAKPGSQGYFGGTRGVGLSAFASGIAILQHMLPTASSMSDNKLVNVHDTYRASAYAPKGSLGSLTSVFSDDLNILSRNYKKTLKAVLTILQ